MPLKHFYEVTIDVGGGVVYTGKGPTEKTARAAAKKLAKKRGISAAELKGKPERIESLVGPEPRTFKGNASAPEA